MDRRRRHSLSSLHASAPFSSTMAIRADPWRLRVIDANGLALAHLYGQPPDAVAFSDKRLTNDEAEKLARLIARPEPGRTPWEIFLSPGTPFSSDGGRPHMKRAPGRGTRRPCASCARAGRGIRRCADGRGMFERGCSHRQEQHIGTLPQSILSARPISRYQGKDQPL
jgi:hypothetical protein